MNKFKFHDIYYLRRIIQIWQIYEFLDCVMYDIQASTVYSHTSR
jgi:hypothetical protein